MLKKIAMGAGCFALGVIGFFASSFVHGFVQTQADHDASIKAIAGWINEANPRIFPERVARPPAPPPTPAQTPAAKAK